MRLLLLNMLIYAPFYKKLTFSFKKPQRIDTNSSLWSFKVQHFSNCFSSFWQFWPIFKHFLLFGPFLAILASLTILAIWAISAIFIHFHLFSSIFIHFHPLSTIFYHFWPFLPETHKNFSFLACPRGFFQARAQKLMDSYSLRPYWAQKWVYGSIPFEDLHSYPLSMFN